MIMHNFQIIAEKLCQMKILGVRDYWRIVLVFSQFKPFLTSWVSPGSSCLSHLAIVPLEAFVTLSQGSYLWGKPGRLKTTTHSCSISSPASWHSFQLSDPSLDCIREERERSCSCSPRISSLCSRSPLPSVYHPTEEDERPRNPSWCRPSKTDSFHLDPSCTTAC